MTIAALTIALSSSAPAQVFRAFWADAFHEGFKSTSEINSMVSRAQAGRYNAIVAEVLAFHDTTGSGHGAYWNSAIVPHAADVSGGIDPLALLVQTAHAAGIEVHAWIVPYRVCAAWPPSNNGLVAAHPEWLMVPLANLGNGPATVGGYYTLDPGSPEAQEYLTNIVQELVNNYAIDGINLDYIRYVQTDAGYPAVSSYAKSSLARFQQISGYVGVPPSTGNTAWDNFRRRTIDEYVRRLRAEIPSITSNPRQPLRLSADLICFGNSPSTWASSSAYALFQDWRKWMELGWLDAGVPMNYKREHVSNEATWYRNWVNAAIGWRYNRHMYCGQAVYLNTKANSVTQLSYSLSHGANGVVTYSYAATADQNTDGNPESDWTWYTYVATNLFTSPATTPSMPWRSSATATEGTLWGRVINGTTGQPIDDATVQVGALTPVLTDGNGYFTVTLIPAIAAGTSYTVTALSDTCPQVSASGIVVTAGGIALRNFTLCPGVPPFGDMDGDGDVDFADFAQFVFCLSGPDIDYPPGQFCLDGDSDADFDVDMADFMQLQRSYGSP
ncbi:MAG: family 10 glycosylhydrolase [Planctomycetes bacterium]|nr:family 10 glycosylhydrolase [Planctomycetota bacterium]